MRYKPCPTGMPRKGEVCYAWTASQSTMSAYEMTKYSLRYAQGTAFTGQYLYSIPFGDMDDITIY